MRVRLLGVLTFLFVSLPVQAQDGTRFGLKLGVSSAELRGDGGGFPARTGVNAGAFVDVPVVGSWGVLGEGNVYRKGYTRDEVRGPENEFVGTDVDLQYDYASLLTAGRYNTALGTGGLDLTAFIGPRLDVLIGERMVVTSFDGERETVSAELSPNASDFSGTVLGVTAGIGLDLTRAIALPLLVELRYNADVTPAWSPGSSDRLRFRTFDLRVGLSF